MKTKKKKIKKPSAQKIRCAEIVKKYITDYCARNSCTVKFAPESYEQDFSLECTIGYPDFMAVIKYIGNQLVPNFDFDFYFKYENSDELFSIYDIFNLFDIKDFNYYFYNNCIDENSIVKALDEITATIDKYYYDIKKAGNQENLPRLAWQRKDDIKKANGEEEPEDQLLDFSHIIYLTTTAKTKVKLIKRLEKAQADDELVLYERRLLQYLKDGGDVIYSSSRNNDSDRIFHRISRKVNAVILLHVTLIVATLEVMIYKLNYEGAYVPLDDYFWGVPIQLVFIVAAVFALTFLIAVTVGRIITLALCPDDVKGYAKEFHKNMNGETKIDKVINHYLAPIGAAFLAIIFLLGASINIGFYDDYFKIYYTPARVEEHKYEDVEFARVMHYGSADDYEEIEGVCYAILWDENYYTLDECDELGETDKKIKEIASAFGKEIKEIDNTDILENMYYEEEI